MGLVSFATLACAADKAAFAMSINEFRQLSPADQKALLARAFKHRLEHAKNIYFEVQVRQGGYEFRNDQVGKRVFDLNGRNYRLWRLGDVYRMDSERGGVDIAKPNEFISDGFDPGAGIGKSTVRFSGNTRSFGRIDVEPDVAVEDNRLAYWLDGKHVPWGEYLFRYLVDHKDSYTIEEPVDQNMVRLTVPWQTIYSLEPWGKREFTLDPSKGFLPICGKAHWETNKFSGGITAWRTEVFVVEASKLVGDVWMPMKLKEVISGNTLRGKCNVLETKVTKIEWGTVKAQDIEFLFSPGTEVVDAIKGVTYVVGPNGEPTNVQRIGSTRPEFASPKAPNRNKNMVSILIGTGLLIVVAMMITWKFLGKRRAKVES